MRNSFQIALYLFVLIIILTIGGIYFGYTLGVQQANEGFPLNFDPTDHNCSGACNSGYTCNQYGNPPAGKMWSCKQNNAGIYKCGYSDINEGGNSCYLSCDNGWQPCGCDENECESRCMDTIGPGQSGTYSMLCDNCGQIFTCSCSKPLASITPTVTTTLTPPLTTVTPTITPTGTPIITITPTITPFFTPTIYITPTHGQELG